MVLEIEGIPPHVWREDTAAKILAPSCWIQDVHPDTVTKRDLSKFKLTAWTHDPSSIPTFSTLVVAEGAPMRAFAAGGAPGFTPLTPYLRRKNALRYRIITHLTSVADFSPTAFPWRLTTLGGRR